MEIVASLIPLLLIVAVIGGLFFAFRPKDDGSTKLACPMCSGSLSCELDISAHDEVYELNSDYDILSSGECPFCKLPFDIIIHREEETIKAIDSKWVKTERAYDKKTIALDEKQFEIEADIDDLKEEIEEAASEADKAKLLKKLGALEKKMETIESRIEKADESFSDKEERYTDRQMNWQEKYDSKYG